MTVNALIQDLSKMPKVLTGNQLLFNGAIELVHNSNELVLKLNKPIHFLIDGDLQITVNGEVSTLTKGNVHFDGKEVHLNSRNCKQIRLLFDNQLKTDILEEIGDVKDLKQIFIDLKEDIKQQIRQELLEELKHNV